MAALRDTFLSLVSILALVSWAGGQTPSCLLTNATAPIPQFQFAYSGSSPGGGGQVILNVPANDWITSQFSEPCYSGTLSFYWWGNTPTPLKILNMYLNASTHEMRFSPPAKPLYPGPVMVKVGLAGAKYVSIVPLIKETTFSFPIYNLAIYLTASAIGEDPSLVSATLQTSTGNVACNVTTINSNTGHLACAPLAKPGIGPVFASVSVTRNGIVYSTPQATRIGTFAPIWFNNETNFVPVTSTSFQLLGDGFNIGDSVQLALIGFTNVTGQVVAPNVVEVTIWDVDFPVGVYELSYLYLNNIYAPRCLTCQSMAVVTFYPVMYASPAFYQMNERPHDLYLPGVGFGLDTILNYAFGTHTLSDSTSTLIHDTFFTKYCGAVKVRELMVNGISNPELPANPLVVAYAGTEVRSEAGSSQNFSLGLSEITLRPSISGGGFNPNPSLMNAVLYFAGTPPQIVPSTITYVNAEFSPYFTLSFEPITQVGSLWVNFSCEGGPPTQNFAGEVIRDFIIVESANTISTSARRFTIDGFNFGTDPSAIDMTIAAPPDWVGERCAITVTSLTSIVCEINPTRNVTADDPELKVLAHRIGYSGSTPTNYTIGWLSLNTAPILHPYSQVMEQNLDGRNISVLVENVNSQCSFYAYFYTQTNVSGVSDIVQIGSCWFDEPIGCYPNGPPASGPGIANCYPSAPSGKFEAGQLYAKIFFAGLESAMQPIATVLPNPTVIEDTTAMVLPNAANITFRARNTGLQAVTQGLIQVVGSYTIEYDCHEVFLSAPDPSGEVSVTCTFAPLTYLEVGEVSAKLSRGSSFGAYVHIATVVEEPILTPHSVSYASELGFITFSTYGTTDNQNKFLPNLTLVFLPSGYCEQVQAVSLGNKYGYIDLKRCHFQPGDLYAAISVFGSVANPRLVAHIVPAPTTQKSNLIFQAVRGELQNVTIHGTFDSLASPYSPSLRVNLTTELKTHSLLTTPFFSPDNTTVTFEVELQYAGNLTAYIAQFSSFGDAVQIGTVFFTPIVSRKNLVAKNAYQLKIYGDNFDPQDIPEVTLVWWPGDDDQASYEYIQQSDINQIPLGCDVENWVEKTGVIWASIRTFNRESTPAVVASFTDPPTVKDTTSSLLSISSPEITMYGTGFDTFLAEVVVTLSDGQPAEVVRIQPNEFVVVKVNLRSYTASQSGELKLVSLNLHSYGADAQGTVGTIVNPSSFTLPSFTKIAASVRRLSFSGSGFGEAVADNEIRFWLDLGAEGNFTFSCPSIEATSLSKTSMTCLFPVENPITSHPGAVGLYFQIWTFGGPADAPTSKRTAPSPGWTYLAPLSPAPAITVVADSELPELEISDSTQVTISGANFDASGASTSVDFVDSETECQIASVSQTSIVCTLTGTLLSGSLTAVVSSFQGVSNQAKVATLVPPPESNAAVVGPAVAVPLGVLLIAGAIVGGIFLMKFLKRRRLRSLMTAKASKFREDEKAYNEMTDLTERARLAQEALRPYEIPKGKVEFGKELGAGAFGKVYLGKYDGKKIAIKQAQFVDEVAREAFLQEAKLMLGLEPHRNVVRTWGIIIEADSSYYLVLEYLAGSLDKIIYTPENHDRLTEADLIGFAKGIAQGMAHLASQKLVHRDLAVRNVLLSKDQTCKISDFGMSRRLEEQKAVGRTSGNVGPIFWMSPEALDQSYSEKSDVWAYGVTLFEMVAGKQPFEGMELLEAALNVRDKGANPGVPQGAPKLLAKLMKDCWAVNPDARPTFEQICSRFD